MNSILKTAWADAGCNEDFIYVKTHSGYRSSRADPLGVEHRSAPDVSDIELGEMLLDALARSRFVVHQARDDIWIHPEASVDKDLYDHGLTNQRYDEWVNDLLASYSYKTKRSLFKNMRRCSMESVGGAIKIRPSCHEKLEGWSGKGISENDYVVVLTDSGAENIGKALRLAFSRCR